MRSITLLLSLFLLTTLSCQEKEKLNTKECGALKEFKMDKAYAKNADLPEIDFTLQYPENIKARPAVEGKDNKSYNYFAIEEDGTEVEMLSLGHLTYDGGTFEEHAKGMLEFIKTLFASAYTLKDPKVGMKTFDGKKYPVFQSHGKISNPGGTFDGEYLINTVILENPNPELASLIVIMVVQEGRGVVEFEDFAEKACISTIWKTIEYTN